MPTTEPLLRLINRALSGGISPDVILYLLGATDRSNHALASITRLPLFLVATLRRLAFLDPANLTTAVIHLRRAKRRHALEKHRAAGLLTKPREDRPV